MNLSVKLRDSAEPKKKKKIDIPQPYLIKMYNEGMGGVDLLDRLLGSYRPTFRSKKWYWNLFSNALNMAVVAGWILHSHLHK
ncbi:PiggyBac transposable element-derived protein 3, partial [Stegodyphus mimosarum]